jgi:hypothetical protein
VRQKDVILSVGTVALILVAVGVVAVTANTAEFAAWAWARHHNELSWYIRPLFLLPFCYFAYKRSLWGITLTVVALATSMFWFPAPQRADPGRLSFWLWRESTSRLIGRCGRCCWPCSCRPASRRLLWRSGSGRLSGDWR